MAGAQSTETQRGRGSAAAKPSTLHSASASAEVEKGSAKHKQGALAAATVHYKEALNILKITWKQTDGPCALKDVPQSEVASDALHFLGALQLQQLTKEHEDAADKDEDDPGQTAFSAGMTSAGACRSTLSAQATVEVQKSLFLLRAAVDALPESCDAAKRARALNSVGTALLLLGPDVLEEAAEVLHAAVSLAPTSWHVRSNLVKVFRRQVKTAAGKEEAALNCKIADALAEMALLRPDQPGIFYRLGMALKRVDRFEEATAALEEHLCRAEAALAQSAAHDDQSPATAAEAISAKPSIFAAWKTAQTRHWLAVLRGEDTATAPPEYVAALFDNYAERFEEHLVQKLHYNTPALLTEDIRQAAFKVSTWKRCADLGCGTGLMCPPLRKLGFNGSLEGVDLSEGMLFEALKKGGPGVGYDRLLCGDLVDIFTPRADICDEVGEKHEVEALRIERPAGDGDSATSQESSVSCFELVVASDVFVYIGDLEPVFRRVARWLAPEGVFAFSTEALESSRAVSFKLTDSGRYAHHPDYVHQLGHVEGFEICSCRAVVLRMNAGKPVNGHVHVLRRRP